MRSCIIIFLFISCSTSGCAQLANDVALNDMENYTPPVGKRYEKNPYYAVQIYSNNCTFDLRLNDMLVYKYLDSEGGFSSLVPLNDNILLSGKQEITAHIMPKQGETQLSKYATFKIEVRLYKDVDDPVLEYDPVLFYELKVPEEGMPATIFKDVFMAEVPYKLEAWSNSKDLTKEKNIKEKVFQFYRGYQGLVQNKNLIELVTIDLKREKEIAQAFYFTIERANERLKTGIEAIKNPEAILQPLETARLVFYANGKVVNLEMPDGGSALRSIIETKEEDQLEGAIVEGDETITFSLMLHKPKGSDKLEIIR